MTTPRRYSHGQATLVGRIRRVEPLIASYLNRTEINFFLKALGQERFQQFVDSFEKEKSQEKIFKLLKERKMVLSCILDLTFKREIWNTIQVCRK